MSTSPSPFTDPAKSILAGDPALDDAARADLWDTFHDSKDPAELAQKLQPLVVPDDTKRQLYLAKQQLGAVAPPVSKATAAINGLAQIDPRVLDLAESHPNVLKILTAAATTPTKEAGDAAGGTAGTGKGKTQETAPLVQPPRPDGLEHLPPIPEGHHRVLASDGGLHDIPAANIEKAREIDPRLHVLNP